MACVDTFVAGSDVTFTLTAKDETDTVINLTGATLEFTLQSDSNSSAEVTKTTSSGIAISSPATDGIFVVTLTDTDTANLSGLYKYQVKITDNTNLVSYLIDQDDDFPQVFFKQPL